MTPKQMLDVALARAGIHNPSTDQYNRARTYLNIIKTDVENMTDWRFLYAVGTITTVADQRNYSLASDVLNLLHAWDYTNNRPLVIRNPEDVTEYDPDEDMTGEPTVMAVTGVDSSGYWEVDLYPTPDTASETIKYRYYATLADLTSSDDDTDLAPKYPKWLQNALLWGLCALYKEEKENSTAGAEWEKFTLAIQTGMKVNGRTDVPQRVTMERADGRGNFVINATINPD